MFYSFEIKNNMEKSIEYYQKLNNSFFSQQTHSFINLKWASPTFQINETIIKQFGVVKIREAQEFRDMDDQLKQLKVNEHKEMEEAKRKGDYANIGMKNQQNQAQFKKLAEFYFD